MSFTCVVIGFSAGWVVEGLAAQVTEATQGQVSVGLWRRKAYGWRWQGSSMPCVFRALVGRLCGSDALQMRARSRSACNCFLKTNTFLKTNSRSTTTHRGPRVTANAQLPASGVEKSPMHLPSAGASGEARGNHPADFLFTLPGFVPFNF